MQWHRIAAALAVSMVLAACGEETNGGAPVCGADEVACGASCARLADDPRNCGACGNQCAPGAWCRNGACLEACPAGSRTCDGACVDVAASAEHCGACGNACAPGELCADGVCTASCPAGQTRCDGACHTLAASPAHCGACGNACGAGEVCADGSCVASCPAGQAICDGGCHDLQRSRLHCGACGAVCGAGEICVDGACVEETGCTAGRTSCDGACVDLQTDRLHCGACGIACAADELCGAGACVRTCADGFVDCDGACRDPRTDAAHCGGCGNACGAGEACVDGACVPSCGPFASTVCDGVCTNTDLDPRHCGRCGNACGAGLVCTGGVCSATCGPDDDVCGDLCTDLGVDPANCGACGNACPGAPGAMGACYATECLAVCVPGRLDCDGDLGQPGGNGCEVDASSDVAHCGACGNGCRMVPNGTAACLLGTCGIGACNAGWSDCNADPGDGCETDVATDEANCGACNLVCQNGDVCHDGTCIPQSAGESCADPFVLVAGTPGVVSRIPATLDHFTAAPSCAAEAPAGGDLVLRFDAPASGPAEIVVRGAPGGPRRHLVVAGGACGATTPEIACSSNPNGGGVRAGFTATAGTTYWAYLADAGSGGIAADAPLSVHARVYDCPSFTPGVEILEPASGGELTRSIAVTFTAPVSTAGGSFTITGDRGTHLVLAADGPEVAQSGDGQMLTLQPGDAFPQGETLTVTWTGITDANCGKAIAAPAWTFTAGAPQCRPGVAGMVGTTVELIDTGAVGSGSEYYLAVDTDPDGWVYVGGLNDLYRFRKDGSAIEPVHVLANLGASQLGYHALVDGRNIYVAESKTTGTTGHVYRISADGGATWRVEDAARFPTDPGDDIHTLASWSGRIYMLTHEGGILNHTQIWSINADAPVLPADATLDIEFGANEYKSCAGLVVDAQAFYVNCLEGNSSAVASVLRIDRATGTVRVLASGLHGNGSNMGLVGSDADGDGVVDYLYRNSNRREGHFICDPAAPYAGVHHDFGSGPLGQTWGLAYDPVANVLWAFDDQTNQLVRIR